MGGVVLMSKRRTYLLKFGLNSLIEIEQLTNRNVEDVFENGCGLATIRLLFYYGLNKEYDFQEVGNIIDELLETMTFLELSEALQKALFSSLGYGEGASTTNDVSSTPQSIDEQVEELFPTLVGELGIAPNVFYEMTPAELSLVGKGKDKRQENLINSLLIAWQKINDDSDELFSFSNELGFSHSTLRERNETFNDLGID